MWVIPGLISSFFLGIYDLFKKTSLKDNAVIPVLFYSTVISLLMFIPFILISIYHPAIIQNTFFEMPVPEKQEHWLIFLKAIIVASSWLLAYFSLKNLPITIVSPVRASGPLWTLLGAILIFHEQLTVLQWSGLIITLFCYYLFSLSGKKEGIDFLRNKWVIFIFLATIIGTISSLYDKYLIIEMNRIMLQAWFTVYMVAILLPVLFIFWYPKRKNHPFKWRYQIIFIGISLTLADFAYFYALSFEDALISILSLLRRSSVIISFSAGAVIFKEVNIKQKSFVLVGILVGVILIILGSS